MASSTSQGGPGRFHNQSAFGDWTGVVPGVRQSSEVESKGLRMTKTGPAIVKRALYQAGDVGRQWNPQLGLCLLPSNGLQGSLFRL